MRRSRSNVATYRAAGACGFYKIGGFESGNIASATAEHLGDLEHAQQLHLDLSLFAAQLQLDHECASFMPNVR